MTPTSVSTPNKVIEELSVNREIERQVRTFINNDDEFDYVFICTSSGEPIAKYDDEKADLAMGEVLYRVTKTVAAMQSAVRGRLNKDRVKSSIVATEAFHIFVTPVQIKTRGAFVSCIFKSECTLGMAEYKTKQIVSMLTSL